MHALRQDCQPEHGDEPQTPFRVGPEVRTSQGESQSYHEQRAESNDAWQKAGELAHDLSGSVLFDLTTCANLPSRTSAQSLETVTQTTGTYRLQVTAGNVDRLVPGLLGISEIDVTSLVNAEPL